eukprot:TRINITY_DN57_c0_g1_i3.p1 TRINITY_DN57_c0_g1~~TRINITY_DN57_c0_g1_i3.p1  ORF type:complete len:343 (-),score=44.11 TRINITY_DN57_c0_g1_i3:5098-6126(-)
MESSTATLSPPLRTMGGTILLELYHHLELEHNSWIQRLGEQLPDHKVLAFKGDRHHHNISEFSKLDRRDLEEVEYAVIWRTPIQTLAKMPKLRAVLLCGAGADHLKPFDALPNHIPIVRLVDQDVARNMATYVLHWVVHFHFAFDVHQRNQTKQNWERTAPLLSRQEFCVGVLGFGNIGREICRAMRSIGYRVIACRRSRGQEEGIQCYSVADMDSFLSECNALINILPLTAETENMVNLSRLLKLRKGAIFVCLGRGATFVEKDLCEALDRGHLTAAVLDTFREEPLPLTSPFWTHERIVVTPHISGATLARSSAKYVVDNIKRIERGEQPFPILDRQLQY